MEMQERWSIALPSFFFHEDTPIFMLQPQPQKMNPPLNGVSVIIPTYNREKYLKECLDSVLAQEYDGPLEIVVCDDGSTDKTLEIADSYGPPVVVVWKPEGCKDQGAGPTRNRGFAACQYPYIAFLDSDDYYLPGHLGRLANALAEDPEVMMVFDEAVFATSKGHHPVPYLASLKVKVEPAAFLIDAVPQTNAFMFRRTVLDEIGIPFNTSLQYGEDVDFKLRVTERFLVKFVPGLGSAIREHTTRSIYTCKGKTLYEYDMKFLQLAKERFPYPQYAIRIRKAKALYKWGMDELRGKKYFLALTLFLQASYTCPGLVYETLKEKMKKFLG